jgi:hypothetical protein
MMTFFATGVNLREKQPQSLTVPHTSWTLVDDSLESLMEFNKNGEHCLYLKDANSVDSKTAQVPTPLRNIFDVILTD